MKIMQSLKHLLVEGIRKSGPGCWPWLSHIPKIGKYALAQRLSMARGVRQVCPPGQIELLPGLAHGEPTARQRAKRWLAAMNHAPIDISRQVIIQAARRRDFSFAKAAVIAHWDPDGLIDPYVLYYAAALKRLGYCTLLVSDRVVRLPAREAPDLTSPDELPEPLDAIVIRDCPGYDFTSWKAALTAFPSLYKASELLCSNDSIFAPVGELAAVHEALEQVDCDFWGLVESHDQRPHLQSYYLVFRPAALRSEAFARFWQLVGNEVDKQRVIRHELNLSLWLAMHGLQAGAFSPAANQMNPQLNPTHCGWDFLLHGCRVPLLKRDLLFNNPYRISLQSMEQALLASGYPVELILNYARRRGLKPLFPSQRLRQAKRDVG